MDFQRVSCAPLCLPEKIRFPWLFVALSGQLARTEWQPLSEPTLPVSPQAAGPAVPERGIGPGGVPGCSGMPGSEKVQPAPPSSRIQGGGQDTVARHDRFSAAVKKVLQWEQDNLASKGREMIDDFCRWGRSRRRGIDAPLRKEGWRVEVAREFDNPNASLSEGEARAAVVGASAKLRIGGGINGFPAFAAVQLCEAAPRVSPPCRSRCTRRTRGDAGGVSDPCFRPLVRRVRRFTGARRGAW